MSRDGWFAGASRAVVVALAGGAFAFGLSATPACGSDDPCGCNDTRTYPGSSFTTAHRPLECICSSGTSDCVQYEAGYEAYLCGGVDGGITQGTVVRWTGCGRVTLGAEGGFGGRALTFDAKTGAVVGVEDFSDVNSGPCNTFQYAYGTTLEDCGQNEQCTLCGAGAARTCP